MKIDPTDKFKHQQDPEYVYKVKDCEFWWNLPIKTATKLKHNKPDIVAWDRAGKICKIIEISCPADDNITKKVEEKLNNYGPLVRNLQIMYSHYKIRMVPIVRWVMFSNVYDRIFINLVLIEGVYVTIGNPAFSVFLYLTGVHFRGELQHGGDVSE